VEGVVRGAHRLAGIVDQLVEFAQLTEGTSTPAVRAKCWRW